MFKGETTTSLYNKCIAEGLCEAHRKELQIPDDHESSELQRKAMLFIRLQIFGPILFKRPFSCEKMRLLFAKADCFSERENLENHDEFLDKILILDSIAVFLLCHFSKVCCVGAFFKSGPRAYRRDSEDIFLKLLTRRTINETDIGLLTPLLSDNFKTVSDALLKVCYVAVLLFVRNVSVRIEIRQAVNQLEVKIGNDAKESQHWESVGDDAFKRKSWEEAYEAYSVALSYRPYCPCLLINRSHCLTKMWKLKDAFMDGYLAVMVDPYNIDGYNKMIISLCMLEDFVYCIDMSDYCLYKCSEDQDDNKFETIKKIRSQVESALMEKAPELANVYIARLEERDLPELIDASDSDSECQEVPDLMEASNSDESDSNINCSNSNINGTPNGSLNAVEDQVKMLQESLKEASQTLLDGCAVMAVRRFQNALEEIKGSPEIHKYEECDIICIKYAYAFACYKSDGYDNIQKAITILKEITEENKDIVFPAAYYCIGLAYLKMNRFKLALEYFKILDDLFQKEAQCNVFVWPGLETVIDETKLGYLKNVLPDLIRECENPPLPNATCRFEGCSLQPSIYYTDPDFKGLYSIQCSEQCCLQYHVQCWKSIRALTNHTDKEFLEQKCFTPDCEGSIVNIQIINKGGEVGKEFSLESKKVSKQKKTKLEKKLEIKVEKKRKRKDSSSRTESISEMPEDISNANSSECEITNPPKEIKSNPKHDVKNSNGNGNFPIVSSLSVNAEPFIVLKKEKLVNETSNKVPSKVKEHKKIKSNTYSIDEFLQKSGAPLYSHYQQKLKTLRHARHSSAEAAWVKNTNNPYMPAMSTTDANQSMSSLSSFDGSPEILKTEESDFLDLKSDLEFPKPSFNLIECIKKNMYSHFKEILGKYGPLRVDDPRLTNKVKNFPEEAQILADSDGIGKFLQENVEFAFVRETYVCLVDQLAVAYKKIDETPISVQNMDVNVTNNFKNRDSKNEKNTEIFHFSCLNPDAREYLPDIPSELTPENVIDVKSDKKIVKDNSPVELISTNSKLKKPLTVDQKTIESLSFSLQEALSEASSTSLSSRKEAIADSIIMELVRRFKETMKFYNNEEVKEHQNCIDACPGQCNVIQIPKKSNASVQTENIEVEKVSKGTMQSDDELQRLKERTKELMDEKEVLQEQCKSSLHSASEYRKISTDEITSLKKELDDTKIKLEEKTKEFKSIESEMEEKIKKLSELLQKAQADHLTQVKEIEKLQQSNESLKLDCTVMEDRICTLQQEKLKLRQEVNGKSKLKNDVKNLELEKMEVEKRAQKAECLLLELKKTEFTKIIEIKKTEAANKIEEIKNGMALISAHINPVVAKNMETLISQIRIYVSTLDSILKEFTVQIDEQITEVNKGIPLTHLEQLDVEQLPQMPSLSCELMSSLMYQIPWPLVMTNPAFNAGNLNPYQFPSTSTTIPNTIPNLSNTVQQNPPLSSSYCSSVEDATNQASKQPISSNTKVPPGLNISKTTVHAPAISVHNIPSFDRQTSSAQQKNVSQMSGSMAQMNSNPVKKTPNIKFGSSASLELDYNIKKNGAPFAAARASSSKINTASPMSKKSEKNVKRSFEKILSKLQEKFPYVTASDILTCVKEFRAQRENGLSGLTLENIIQSVSERIEANENKNDAARQVKEPNARTKMMPNAVLVNKKLVSDEKMKAPAPPPESYIKKSAWGNREVDNSKQWSGSTVDECSICYEEMTSSTAYKVDCNHSFHLKCIKTWLEKKSDCPICRVHLLLPEDYPALS